MALRSAQRSALVDQVITQLREQIASGEWPVGERIPTEPELVAELGVGRNTVREGVRALAHAGLLEIRQGCGTFVRASSDMAGAVRRRVAGGTVGDALEVRRGLEVEAARLAAVRRTDDDLAAMTAALEHRERTWTAGHAADFIEADVRLHQIIVTAAHNALLRDLYLDLADAIRHTLEANIGEDLHESGYTDHSRLVAAIAERDVDRAIAEASGYLDELLGRQ